MVCVLEQDEGSMRSTFEFEKIVLAIFIYHLQVSRGGIQIIYSTTLLALTDIRALFRPCQFPIALLAELILRFRIVGLSSWSGIIY